MEEVNRGGSTFEEEESSYFNKWFRALWEDVFEELNVPAGAVIWFPGLGAES